MAGTGTWVDIEDDPTSRAFTVHFMDASGDTWTERLVVAITTTYAAIQAWVLLYQAITQASIWDVTEELSHAGDADPDNATFLARSGIEQGINLSFKNPATSDTFALRDVAPVTAVLQGNQDIPLLSATAMTNFIVATIALLDGYDFVSAQYTGRRERKNNPKVK